MTGMTPNEPISSRPLPPYTYVPGRTPHPVSSDQGHSRHALPVAVPCPAAAADWSKSDAFRWGVRLFDAGYYWEAHEAWEALWQALPRGGRATAFVQGLIKAAACGVKCLEGNVEGGRRHALRAAELVTSALERAGCTEPGKESAGRGDAARPQSDLPFSSEGTRTLLERLRQIADDPPALNPASDGTPRPVLNLTLGPLLCRTESRT